MRIRAILASIALLVVACLGPAAIPKTQTPPPILPTASQSTQAPSTNPPTALSDTPVPAATPAAAIPNTQAAPAVGQGPRILNGHTDAVASVAWSPDGKELASGSIDQTVWSGMQPAGNRRRRRRITLPRFLA
jgi:hypothetical protein